MCEIITQVTIDGQAYLLPVLVEYHSARLKLIQECLTQMADYISEVFPRHGRIFLGWNDDKNPPSVVISSNDFDISEINRAWNQRQNTLSCITELRSKK